MTTIVSKPLTLAEQLFYELILQPEIDAGLAALFVAVPFLAVWPLSSIVTALVNFGATKLYSGFTLLVDIEAIKLIDDAQQTAWDSASLELASLANSGQGPGTPAFEEAKANAAKALSQFVSFGPDSLMRARDRTKYLDLLRRGRR